jgi:hypothetical protein
LLPKTVILSDTGLGSGMRCVSDARAGRSLVRSYRLENIVAVTETGCGRGILLTMGPCRRGTGAKCGRTV